MREEADHWEYMGTYVDYLAIASEDPQAIVDKLVKEYKFKLKGTGPISYHLGCDFVRDEDKVLCIQPRKYIERMVETYVRMFGEKPKELYSLPLDKEDHPELDSSNLLDKISTSLVECEHVKAKIGKALRADGSPRMWKKLPPARGQKGFLS